MPAWPAHLPDPLIGLFPGPLQVIEQGALHPPGILIGFQSHLPRQVQRIHDFAKHIQLELPVGRVADPHRRRALVARQPFQGQFRQPPFPGQPVHDVELRRLPRHGTQQPLAPGQASSV